jgi:hypothetical protein
VNLADLVLTEGQAAEVIPFARSNDPLPAVRAPLVADVMDDAVFAALRGRPIALPADALDEMSGLGLRLYCTGHFQLTGPADVGMALSLYVSHGSLRKDLRACLSFLTDLDIFRQTSPYR